MIRKMQYLKGLTGKQKMNKTNLTDPSTSRFLVSCFTRFLCSHLGELHPRKKNLSHQGFKTKMLMSAIIYISFIFIFIFTYIYHVDVHAGNTKPR